jgi:Tol biopolymer transport system component
MNRSFIRNLAFVVMFSILPALIALPIQDTILARAQATASATPSKTAPATAKGIPRIVFVSNKDDASNIFAVDPDGKNIVQLTKSSDYKMFPTFSPDGRQIAFLSSTQTSGTPQLKVMDADGKNLRQLPLGKAVAISPPAWSPDSSEIAYISVRAQPKDSSIYIFNVAKQQETKLKLVTPVDFSYKPDKNKIALTDAFAPSWSPDGKYLLAFGGLAGLKKTMLLISLNDGSAKVFLQDSSLIATSAIWSPDGSKVLVTVLEAMGLSIQIADPEGQIVFALNPSLFFFPAWSPDGKQIAFTILGDYAAPIGVMNADGSDIRGINKDEFSGWNMFASWAVVPAELVHTK